MYIRETKTRKMLFRMQVVTGGKALNNVSKLKQPEMHRAKQNIIKEITDFSFYWVSDKTSNDILRKQLSMIQIQLRSPKKQRTNTETFYLHPIKLENFLFIKNFH